MTDDRFAAPQAPVSDAAAAGAPVHYVGFWARCGAAVIDTMVASLALAPLAYFFGVDVDIGASYSLGTGGDFFRVLRPHGLASLTLNWLLPAVAVLAFWFTRGATPGKMVISAVIVDARTLGPATQGQLVARYLGYFVSTIPAGLGLLWVAFDGRKQGWHDKIAGTVVIRRPRRGD